MASVSDQSGGYVILRISGPAARTLLQRGAPVDLHPSAFGPGSVAATVIAHIGVIIRQLDATPAYEIALFRSYAASFGHWLDAAVAAL
jgi:sarcosine oxidase subunit gamma